MIRVEDHQIGPGTRRQLADGLPGSPGTALQRSVPQGGAAMRLGRARRGYTPQLAQSLPLLEQPQFNGGIRDHVAVRADAVPPAQRPILRQREDPVAERAPLPRRR